MIQRRYRRRRAARQGRTSRSRQRRVRLEGHIIVCLQISHSRNRLTVHQRSGKVGQHVPFAGIVRVLGNFDGQIVAPCPGIQGGCKIVRRLARGSTVQLVQVQDSGMTEQIAQSLQLFVRVLIPEQLHGIFLQIFRGNGHNFPILAPIQRHTHSHNATGRHFNGRGTDGNEIDIAAGKFLVLRKPQTAAKCHITSPVLSYNRSGCS